MIVSAPIPQIALVLSLEFKDSSDTKDCIDLLEGIKTSDTKTKLHQIDNKFDSFINSLKHNKELKYFTASFLAFYFQKRDMNEQYSIFVKLSLEIGEQSAKDFKNLSYISGIFTSCLMNDLAIKRLDSKQSLPEHIEQAVKYIESEDFTVFLEKNNG